MAVNTAPDSTSATSGIPGPRDLATRARLAVAWATAFQIFRDVVQFGLTLVLVRLLPTDAYGQFGLLTTLLTFFTFYSFREFLNYTLQVRDGDAPHYQDHFTAGAVVQAGMVLLVNAVAVAFRWLPDYAPVSPVLHVMSLLFVLDLPGEFRTRMLERNLDWRRLRALQAVGFASGGVLSIAMAIAGLGVWALIVPTLLFPLPFIWDLFVKERWRPTWEFQWSRFRPAVRFGAARMLTATFLAAAALSETMTLTSALGFGLFGVFGRAIGLAQLLCGRIGSVLSIAIYPVLTRVPPSSESFKRAGALYLRSVAWSAIPMAALAAIFAEPIVRILYGTRWMAAVPLIPWAMASIAAVALVQTAYTVLLAHGRQRDCLLADGWRLVGTVGALFLALPYGPAAYLVVMSAVHAFGLILVSTMLWRRDAMAEPALHEALIPAVVSTTLASTLTLWLASTSGLTVASAAGVAVFAPVYLVVYVLTLRVLFRVALEDLLNQFPKSDTVRHVLRLERSAA